jgi:uncharacterized PurR-regulated membrane protein YhhQ (DUF165 family)
MNKAPSYKIIVPFAAVYTLCLFMPTIDALARLSFTIFGFPIKFSIAVPIFAAIFPMADSLTEVYGKNVTYYVSIACYIIIIGFSLINNFLLSHVDTKQTYDFLVRSSLIITIAGPISYVVTFFINIHFLYKLKIKMREKHFFYRSFICSAISGFIMSLIVQGALCYQFGFTHFLETFLTIFVIKLLVTIPYVYIAKHLVILYRYVDGIDYEPYNTSLASHDLDKRFSHD